MFSTLVITRETQLKAVMESLLTFIRLAKTTTVDKQGSSNGMLDEDGEVFSRFLC